MRLFTCDQAHNKTCKCTTDQNLSVARVNTISAGGEGGGAPVQSADRHTPHPHDATECAEGTATFETYLGQRPGRRP